MARIHESSRQREEESSPSASITQLASLPKTDRRPFRDEVTDGKFERKLLSIIAQRRQRHVHFATDLFSDPAWDILLELALAERQQRRVCVSSLCIGAQVPTTTALRWIRHMTDTGWLVRKDDPRDRRRTFVELSDHAAATMHAFLTEICREPDGSIA